MDGNPWPDDLGIDDDRWSLELPFIEVLFTFHCLFVSLAYLEGLF